MIRALEKISVGAPASAINKPYTVPSSGSSHLLLTVHAIRAAQLHATLIMPQSTLMYVEKRIVLVKSEEEIGGGREERERDEMRGEKRKGEEKKKPWDAMQGNEEARGKRKKDRSRS